ncbi:AbrB/MazE/SpoVT family DNA-binding domain-containing protein [Lactiplantibacillus sp. WILCCON 0030]|uniref:AbrB/MazE/SpoVT family DNA-binding domain-containing protein n=1 Tax=Lactiplantibacillus brownii TaxID=3069269 RepID=A0ABU1A7I2_9LACO|nr:AbrB/MazE/SpoVT family DNA-binding domain-containing protein [Lactiplantibacillus brownii]MDQ7936393.1 AbrB/MazE/SpoVT family DNA-binding domain-containing protein [Lactiplantibacillus brownii]
MVTTKIVKLGHSQGIRLPKSLLKEVGIDEPINTPVRVSIEDGKIVIMPAQSLMQRFAGFDLDTYWQENDSEEYDWGKSVGKEIF